MHAHPDDVTRMILASLITLGFLGLVFLLPFREIPSANHAIAWHIFQNFAATFGMVMKYYFKRA